MIFVDTGAFLGRYVAADQYHRRAVRSWRVLESERALLVTTNFVLDETLTLLARRTTYAFAAERAEILYAPRSLTVLRPEAADEMGAIELFRKFADQSVSFTDCVSFVLMARFHLTRVFTFDRHFRDAGFEVWP